MDHKRPLAPSFIGKGTLTSPRDMLRALETLENIAYSFVVDGESVDQGRAALVKLMADDDSATLVVNGCLFLNVASFRYLDFETDADGQWRFVLHGDGTGLELLALPETEDESASNRPHLLSEEMAQDYDVLLALDDEDDDE